MPQTIEYVDAVLEGGTQALKMCCSQNSAAGFSNGVYSGPFPIRKAFLQEVVEHAGDVPVGLVPGIPGNVMSAGECAEAAAIGIDFLNCDPALIDWLNEDSKVDMIELGLLPHSEFGKRLCYHDILWYRDILKRFQKPVIVAAERHLLLEEIKYLYDEGVTSLMIGLSVYYEFLKAEGSSLTPDFVKRITAQYRKAIEKL